MSSEKSFNDSKIIIKNESKVTLVEKDEKTSCSSYDSGLNMDHETSSKLSSSSKESSTTSKETTILPQNNSSGIYVQKMTNNSPDPEHTTLNTHECNNLLTEGNKNELCDINTESLALKTDNCEQKKFKIWIDESAIAKPAPLTPTKKMPLGDISVIKDFPQPGCSKDSPQPGCSKDSPQPGCSKDSLQEVDHLESDNNFSIKSDLGNTPSFKRGVLCSSTPNESLPPAKRIKRTLKNLTCIKEDNDEVNAEDPEQSDKKESSEDICHKTVIHKDVLSMVLELPRQNTVNNLEIDADQKNLTIKAKNDLTIAYENLEDRTIDEIIIRDGDIDDEIEAMCKMERELDREKILQKANNLQVFISNDEDENKDNFNPEWEVMKKLETDEERYKAVRKLWMNLHMPDPKEYLSAFNWRKRNSLAPPVNNLPPPPSKENPLTSGRKYYCTEVFDVAINRLNNFYHNRRQGYSFDEAYEHAVLASMKKQPKEHMIGGRKEYLLTMNQLQACVQERMHRNQVAKKEIEAIHKFYNGLRNRDNSGDLMYLSHKERQDILHIEDIITSYSSWYRS